MRAQLRHLNKTTIIIAARPMSGAEQDRTELWYFPWDTTIQRARPGKDPFAPVFEYLHTALHQQGFLLAPPRLVDGEELPEDHPLSPANITQMRGSFLDPVTKFLPSKERSCPRFLPAMVGLPSQVLLRQGRARPAAGEGIMHSEAMKKRQHRRDNEESR